MGEHSVIGASGMHRWAACPGSVPLATVAPRPGESHAAREGTFAHAVAEQWLSTGSHVCPPAIEFRGEYAEVPDDMVDPLTAYVNYVRRLPGVIHHEVRVSLRGLDLSLYRAFGTADTVSVCAPLVEVVDLKYGSGVWVDVIDNVQLMMYALATVVSMKLTGITTIRITIVQPRAWGEPIRSQDFDYMDLIEWAKAALIPAAERVEQAERTFRNFGAESIQFSSYMQPGDHCHWCPSVLVCPKVKMEAQKRAESAFEPVAPDGKPLDAAVVAQYMMWRTPLKAFVDALDEYAYTLANTGERIPGWKLVNKIPRRFWLKPAELPAALALLAPDVDPYVPQVPKLRSPNQLEELGVSKVLVASMCDKASSGTVLAPISDKRTEVVVQTAEQAFSKVQA